jgi:hypothetical protein
MIKILPDNECDDIYFYELLFYTGSRVNAGTDSVVIISLEFIIFKYYFD